MQLHCDTTCSTSAAGGHQTLAAGAVGVGEPHIAPASCSAGAYAASVCVVVQGAANTCARLGGTFRMGSGLALAMHTPTAEYSVEGALFNTHMWVHHWLQHMPAGCDM